MPVRPPSSYLSPQSLAERRRPMSAERSTMERVARGVATILVAVIIWFLPPPAGVTPKAWHLLAIFAATIAGLILQPLPMGAVVIIGTMATALTGTLSEIGRASVGKECR